MKLYFDNDFLAHRIKLKMEVNALSLRDAAKECEISFPTMQRMTKGKMPDLLTYFKLCTWLHLDPKIFFKIY